MPSPSATGTPAVVGPRRTLPLPHRWYARPAAYHAGRTRPAPAPVRQSAQPGRIIPDS